MGKVERTTYALGWRVHTMVTQERLPLAYIVRSANVNDKVPAQRPLHQAISLLNRAGITLRRLIADAQYCWEDFFNLLQSLGIGPIIPAPYQVKSSLISLRVRRGFIVEGDLGLVKLYHRRMMVEHAFRAGDRQLNLDNLRWRGATKVRMHVALYYSVILAVVITADQMGRPDLAHSIKTFQ